MTKPAATSMNHGDGQHGRITKGAIIGMHVSVATNHCLSGPKAIQQEENHACYYKLSQLPRPGGVMDIR